MRASDSGTTLPVSVDEAYERFFDGYYNVGRPGEVFGRDVVLGQLKLENDRICPAQSARPTGHRVRRSRRSTRHLARD